MSHRAILARGFSVTRLADGGIIRSARDARPGMRIETLLADGTITSDVVSPQTPAPQVANATEKKAAAPPTRESKPKPKVKNPPDPEPTLFS